MHMPQEFVPPQSAAQAYEPGYFTALMLRHDWPPRFAPVLDHRVVPNWSAIATAKRALRVAMGDTGTIVGLSQRADDMMRMRAISAARHAR